MILLALSYGIANAMIAALVLLGLVAVCIPRPRKRFKIAETRKKITRQRPKRNQ